MLEITIVLPYRDAGTFWNLWAEAETQIEFRKDRSDAERCTASFAAGELKTFLTRTDPEVTVRVAEKRPADGRFIALSIEAQDTGGGCRLTPAGSGMTIVGHDRSGLLNGVYEFLRLQGWRWVEPGPRGECPPPTPGLKWPEREMEVIPSFQYRGLDAFYESHDSVQYLLWMARNRLNVCFRKPATAKFADKLGMYSRQGGHLLHRLLQPDRHLDSGRTIWEEHPDWFGLPQDGRRTRESATRVQLCLSQPTLVAYVGDELVKTLAGDLAGVDIVDLWGFDTWGATCSCPACRKTGNGADQNLRLLSALRTRLDRAHATGELDRKVWMDTLAYEGTATLESPTQPVPENLVAAGDMCILFPIRRCYRHEIDDAACFMNRVYRDAVCAWHRDAPGLALWVGEYYNVSKCEDLPVLYTRKIPHDMRFYHAAGARGATYMHAVFVNWAMRSLTQMQHAQYAWDVHTDDEGFLEDYFRNRYGHYSAEMRGVYALVEEASLDTRAWRTYDCGVFNRLMPWDGTPPSSPLKFGHFEDAAAAIATAERAVEAQQQAAQIVDALLKREQTVNWEALPRQGHIPTNPFEAETVKRFDTLEYRLGESRRLLVYGIDAMRLLVGLMTYHDALYRRDWTLATACWDDVERTADKMSSYFVPMGFDNPGPGLNSQDALTRTRFRQTIVRCRGARLSGLVSIGGGAQ